MEDSHCDKALEHFKSRSQRPNTHAKTNSASTARNVAYDSDLKDTVDQATWTHVGTSPVVTQNNQLQARRTAVFTMSDN